MTCGKSDEQAPPKQRDLVRLKGEQIPHTGDDAASVADSSRVRYTGDHSIQLKPTTSVRQYKSKDSFVGRNSLRPDARKSVVATSRRAILDTWLVFSDEEMPEYRIYPASILVCIRVDVN